MITNLRYHIDGKNILVRWNYEDININTVQATCRLVKRINGETVKEISNINWNTFHQNGGGCTFEMPNYPVRVEVEEQTTTGDPVTIYRNVKEAPRYQLKSKTCMRIQAGQKETKRLCGLVRKTHNVYVNVDADCELYFPKSLTITEVEQLPGWLVVGHYDHPNGNEHEEFFWPEHFDPDKNRIELKALPLLKEDCEPERYDQANKIPMGHVWFEIASVVNNTEYADLFLMDHEEVLPDESEIEKALSDTLVNKREIKVEQVHLDRIKPKTNGLYPIVCPFCMERMEPHEPVFRAANLGNAAYPAEEDKKYGKFWNNNKTHTLGHVFEWGDEKIKSYALKENPSDFKEVEKGQAPESGVVVAVKDSNGNITSDKLCKYCHNSIPVYSGAYPSVFIGMMGYTGSGKTVYKDCTIHMLRKQKLLPGYKLLCTANNNLASIENLDRFSMLIGTSSNPHYASTSASVSDSTGQSLETKPGNMDRQALDNQSLESYGGINLGSQSLGSPNDTNLGGQERAGLDDTGLGSQILSGTDSMEPGSVNLSEPQNVVDLSVEMHPTPANSWSSANLEDMLSELTKKMEIQTPQENTHEVRQQLPGATAVEYLEPYIYQLRSADGTNGIIMCFFDFPGEVLDPRNETNADYQQDFRKLLDHFDGMVFLFDPMMLSCIQQMEMDRRLEFASYTYQAADSEAVKRIMEKTPCQILEYFRNKFLPVGQLHMPVVFAISKSDAIRDHMPVEKWRNLPFMDESVNGGCSDRIGLDLEEIKNNSREVLEFQGDPLLEDMGYAIADNHVWMCVSATGIAPKDGTMEGRYGNPVRVMEPLEWILYQNQIKNGSSS